MARKKNDSNLVIEHDEISPAVTQQLSESSKQMSEHSQQIMDSYGDGLPYDRSRIISEARFYAAQSAEAVLEFGRRLLLLKEHEAHGDFTRIIDQQFGLHPRAAQRFMQGAIKYLSPKLASKATALSHLGKTKLLELIGEDDDALAELTEGGTIANLTLDDIDRMSSRELRKKLREAQEDITAKNEVIAAKSGKIDELQTKFRKIKKISPDDQLQQARKEVAAIESEIEERVRVQLRSAFTQFQELIDTTGTTDHDDFIATQLDLLDRALLQVRAELGVERTATGGAEWDNDKDAA
jgi:hypothetical protein